MPKPIALSAFSDIADLDDDQVKEIIARVGRDDITVCLKAADERLKDKVLGNVSEEDREAMTGYMEYLGPMRLSEVEHLQRQIVLKFGGGKPNDDQFV